MEIIIGIILAVIGAVLVFYLRPKTKSAVLEMKFMQTKSISELKDIFNQMSNNELTDYREFVELKGNVTDDTLVDAPFSNKRVAYCESKLSQVTEDKEHYIDSQGRQQTRIRKNENVISNERTSQLITMTDSSSKEKVTLEINASGCKLDIPKTFDRFENKRNLNGYRYFNSWSWDRFGGETIGFKMEERTIMPNQNLYVIGEAFKVGDSIHIGKPMDSKKPFIVTTKSEEDLINSSNKNAMLYLIGGIALMVIGVVMLFI